VGAENSREALASPDQEIVASSWKVVVVLKDLDDNDTGRADDRVGAKQFTVSLCSSKKRQTRRP
jgi:hypothetical protein